MQLPSLGFAEETEAIEAYMKALETDTERLLEEADHYDKQDILHKRWHIFLQQDADM